MAQTESEKIKRVLKEAEIPDETQKIYAKIREVEKVQQKVVGEVLAERKENRNLLIINDTNGYLYS